MSCGLGYGDGIFGNRADNGNDVHLLHAALSEGCANGAIGPLDLPGDENTG